MAYARPGYGRAPYGRLLLAAASGRVHRGNIPGTFGRIGLARSAFGGGVLGTAVNTAVIAVHAHTVAEALASQVRWVNAQGAYPIVNTAHSLASGMIGAYFPGHYTPSTGVPDATGSWNALTTQSWGSAGTIVSGGTPGQAMSFDGLHNALWTTSSGLPVASASRVTLGTVFQVTGPAHGNNCAFSVCASTTPAGRLLLGWLTENSPSGYGQVYFNPQPPAGGAATITGPNQPMPTGWLVVVGTVDTIGLTAQCFVNGASIGTSALPNGTNLSGFDTVAFSARITANSSLSPVTLTNGSPNGNAPTMGEDIGTGSPIASDSAGYIPAGTYFVSQDPASHNFVLSQAATGNTTTDTITSLPPYTRMKNGAVAIGVIWNRLLSAAEIATFSANPLAPFFLPEGDPHVEVMSSVIVNAGPYADILSGQLVDRRVPLEGLTIKRTDAPAWVEAMAKALRDANAPVAAARTATGNAMIPFDLQLRQCADVATPVGWHAKLVFDGFAAVEFLGGSASGNLVADAHIVLEWLARHQVSSLAPIESGLKIKADGAISTESIAQAFANILAQLELRSLGSVGISSGTASPVELTVPLRRDNGTASEWALSVSLSVDTRPPAEIGRATALPAPTLFQVSSIRLRLIRG